MICWEEEKKVLDRTILDVKRECDFGAWDVGAMSFKEKPSTQLANHEIMLVMSHYKHELSQMEVSKKDKLKPEMLLSTKEMARHRGGLGSVGWLVDQCCPQLSWRRRRQNDATIQDMLNVNKMIRTTKSIGSKLKIRIVPINHRRFMEEVHDVAHANFELGASQQAHVILAVHQNATEKNDKYQF